MKLVAFEIAAVRSFWFEFRLLELSVTLIIFFQFEIDVDSSDMDIPSPTKKIKRAPRMQSTIVSVEATFCSYELADCQNVDPC